MTSGETEAFTTRLSTAEAEQIHEAVDQTGLSKSDLVARGLRYYIEKNPDGIPAFQSDLSLYDPLVEFENLLSETETIPAPFRDR